MLQRIIITLNPWKLWRSRPTPAADFPSRQILKLGLEARCAGLQTQFQDRSSRRGVLKLVLSLLVVLGLSGCVSSASGLQAFSDASDGYQFLYPLGWVPVEVSNGPDIVFRDIINDTENVSVVISPLTNEKTLQEMGSPSEVGYLMQKNAIAPPNSGRTAELINARERVVGDRTYYQLEYAVTLPNQKRHDLASVVIHRGKLYTINASTLERRWTKVQRLMKEMVNSFTVS